MDRTEKARGLVKKGAAEKKRLAREGKKLVALVVRLRKEIQRSSYRLGVALAKLRDGGFLGPLGYPSFRALCETALGISYDLAGDLIMIAKNFSAAQARNLGTAKAVALVDLARAMPGEHTAAGLLHEGKLRVGSKSIAVRAATAAEGCEAAEVKGDARDEGAA